MRNTDVLEIIKQACRERDDLGSLICDITDHDLLRLIFSNVRGNHIGLRLTNLGLTVVESCFTSWTFRHDKGFITKPCHLLFFDRNCNMPWYSDSRILVLFERQLAMRTKLVGNLDHLVTAFQPL